MKNTKIAKGVSLVCFRASGRRFCFGRGSDVSSMFCTSVVQVEQMNKKVDLTRIEKLPTAGVGHFPQKAPTENFQRFFLSKLGTFNIQKDKT